MLPRARSASRAAIPFALADYKGPTPTGVPAELRTADLVKRGEYLTKAADCEICHTDEGGQPFAGGRAFKTPFGTLYSPNITADKETGIGDWSERRFHPRGAQGIAQGRLASLSGLPVSNPTRC